MPLAGKLGYEMVALEGAGGGDEEEGRVIKTAPSITAKTPTPGTPDVGSPLLSRR